MLKDNKIYFQDEYDAIKNSMNRYFDENIMKLAYDKNRKLF